MNQHPNEDQPTFRHRPYLILLFAAIVLSIASVAKSQELSPPLRVKTAAQAGNQSLLSDEATLAHELPVPKTVIQFNGVEQIVPAHVAPAHAPVAHVNSKGDSGRVVRAASGQVAFEQRERRRQALIERAAMRPKYAQLSASLANFDADSDPDGWRAEIVLRDSKDRVVVMRAQANFELMARTPLADHQNFADANTTPVRWSLPVKFDSDGVARFKLPLREKLRPIYGWGNSGHSQSGLRTGVYGNRRSSAITRRASTGSRHTLQADWRTLGGPDFGELKVRISVPTEGVFEAVAPVQIRPSVLVDTQWPYR